MSAEKRMNLVLAIAILIGAAGGSAIASDVFEARSCFEAPIAKQEVVELLGPGVTHKTIGKFDIFQRRRSCNPVTGCGPWGPAEAVAKPYRTYFAVHMTTTSKTNLFFSVFTSAMQFVCSDIGAVDQSCRVGGTRSEGVVGSHCFWLQLTSADGQYQWSTAGTF